MTLFVNYVAHPGRGSTLNLTVARVLVCLFAAWKVGTYAFTGLTAFPAFLFAESPVVQNRWLAPMQGCPAWVAWEQAATVLCLLLVAAGWRVRLSAFAAAALLTHLAGLNLLLVNEKTFLFPVYFLILYALLAPGDRVAIAREGASVPEYRLHTLRWFLVVFSLIYFFTGLAKLQGGDLTLAWAGAENIRIILQHNALTHLHVQPAAASWIVGYDALLAAIGGVTLFLELGFLVAVLCRWPIAPFVLGLACMHTGILATMHLNYLTDMLVCYAVFVPWDSLRAFAARRVPRSGWRRCQCLRRALLRPRWSCRSHRDRFARAKPRPGR